MPERKLLKVVPVIDILDGLAVHAIKGQRSEYKPLRSVLSPSADPLVVASAFRALGFDELYVADLDAIMARRPNLVILRQIADKTGFKLMVDAGIADIKRAREVLSSGVSKVVIGTETLNDIEFVAEIVKGFGSEQVVVSLDLKGEKLLSGLGDRVSDDPLAALRGFLRMGVTQVIVLDIARVGSGEGVNVGFLKEVLKSHDVRVFVGGGVRDIKDLSELKELGVFGVLVATALHSGRVSIEELRRACLV